MINLLSIFYYITITAVLVITGLLLRKVIQLTIFAIKKIIRYGYNAKDIEFTMEDIEYNKKIALIISISIDVLLILDFLYYPLKYGFIEGIVRGDIHFVTACLYLIMIVMFAFDFEYINNHCKLIENEDSKLIENEDKAIKDNECLKIEE